MVTAIMSTTDGLSGADSDSTTSMQSKSSVDAAFKIDAKICPDLAKVFQSNAIALSHLERKVETVSQTMKAMEHYLSRIDFKLEQLMNMKSSDTNNADPKIFTRHSLETNHNTHQLFDEAEESKDPTADTRSTLVEMSDDSPLVRPKEDGQTSNTNGIVKNNSNPFFVKVEEYDKRDPRSTNIDNDHTKVHHQVLQNSVEGKVDSAIKSPHRRLSWGQRLHELQLYKEINGDCNVPQSHSGGLGAWVSAQRAQHKFFLAGKSSSLDNGRQKGLENLGFIWTLRKRASWDERFEELKKYSENHHGSCDVPSHKTYKHLWTWCQNQRQAHRRTIDGDGKGPPILPERIASMEGIGFKWS